MRCALLSSVSHDLRTPLTVIAGSASSLVEGEKHLNDETKRELAQAIYEEAYRLERLVNNLLEMSRLQAGEIKLLKEWEALEEVVGAALAQLEAHLKDHPVITDLPADLPPGADGPDVDGAGAGQSFGECDKIHPGWAPSTSAAGLRGIGSRWKSPTTGRACPWERKSGSLRSSIRWPGALPGGRSGADHLPEHCGGARGPDLGGQPAGRRRGVRFYLAPGEPCPRGGNP